MRFRVLGPIEARTGDGRLVRLGAEKHRLLLAALLLEANRWVGTARLTEVLWPDRPPPSAASALRTYVSALRAALGIDEHSAVRILGRHGGYQLRIPPEDLDLLVFEDLTERGRRAQLAGDAAAAADLLRRALALWRGPALEDVAHGPAFAAELARLAELRLTALEAAGAARLGLGQHADLVAELGAAAAAEPLRERLHELWLLALYRSGQRAEALAGFRELRGRLVTEVGIEPGPPLQRLHRQMLAADPALDPPAASAPPRPAAPGVVPRQLPPDVAGFTGRAGELVRLARLLAGEPGEDRAPVILAIDGVPGVGKSALAVRVAHRLAHRYPDGQLYADLGGAGTGQPAGPLAVLGSFLRALGAPDPDAASLDEATARFRALTADRRLLVLLDNAADAGQVQPLLPAAPGSAVLITGRRVLSTVDGAVSLHLDVLAEAEAVALLARLVGTPRIDADRAAAEQVARLCGRLPLALRIAAARLVARPGWPVRALADRLSDARRRLDELRAGELGVRASFQVSLDALRAGADPGDRAAARTFALLGLLSGSEFGVPVVARLSAPAGPAQFGTAAGSAQPGTAGGPEPAAEAALERLVDAQLLASPAPGRYRLHDLLRLFAVECATAEVPAPERTAAVVRALSWYRDAVVATRHLLRPGQSTAPRQSPPEGWPFHDLDSALRWLETERANLAAAVAQGAGDPTVPAAIPVATAQALSGFYQVRGHWHDWIDVNRTVLGLAERTGDRRAAAHAHRDLGVAYEMRGDFDLAGPQLSESLAIFTDLDDQPGRAASLTSLGILHHRHCRYAEAIACQRESLAIRRSLDDPAGSAVNLSNLGASHQRLGQYPEAEACYREGLAIVEGYGDRRATAIILGNLGVVAHRQGRHAEAVDRQRRALDLFRELGAQSDAGRSLDNLGLAYHAVGRYDDATRCLGEALAIAERVGERYLRAECLRDLGTTWHARGDADRARYHWEQARKVFAELGVPAADEVAELLSCLD